MSDSSLSRTPMRSRKKAAIKREVCFGESRFDFSITEEDGRVSFLEVKGCTLEKDLVPGGSHFCGATEELLSLIDVLVDGEFIEEKKDLRLLFRGSSNQRVIDMKKGCVIYGAGSENEGKRY